jgi:hypothetical protein
MNKNSSGDIPDPFNTRYQTAPKVKNPRLESAQVYN